MFQNVHIIFENRKTLLYDGTTKDTIITGLEKYTTKFGQSRKVTAVIVWNCLSRWLRKGQDDPDSLNGVPLVQVHEDSTRRSRSNSLNVDVQKEVQSADTSDGLQPHQSLPSEYYLTWTYRSRNISKCNQRGETQANRGIKKQKQPGIRRACRAINETNTLYI
jgi:hypothetical protein